MKKLNLTPEQKRKRESQQKRSHYIRNKEKMNNRKNESRKEKLSDTEYENYFNSTSRRRS